MLVPFGNSDGRGVSLHHGALVTITFFLGGCFVLTTPNETIAHTLHFVSWLGIHRVYESPVMPRAGARAGATGDAGGEGR